MSGTHYVRGRGAMLVWFWRRYEGLGGGVWSGLLFGVAVGVVVFAMWLGLAQIMPARDALDPRAVVAGWPTGAAGVWLAAWIIGFVVITPLAEELAFRGYLMRRLISADFQRVPPGRFTWLSFLVSSAAFGVLHGQWMAGTLAGMAFAAVVYRTGRLARRHRGPCRHQRIARSRRIRDGALGWVMK